MIAAQISSKEMGNRTGLVALIPLGAFEQHGPRMPLATDSLIATALAEMTEKELPQKIMLFPTLWFGDSEEHVGFAGTLSVKLTTFIQMMDNLFTWLDASGFTQAILYNTHGGNKHAAAALCEEFSRGHGLKVKSMYAYTLAVKALQKDLFGVAETHGGSTEMSLLASLCPELRIQDGEWPHEQGGENSSLVLEPVSKISHSGILEGNNKVTCNTEFGSQVAQVMKDELIKKVTSF